MPLNLLKPTTTTTTTLIFSSLHHHHRHIRPPPSPPQPFHHRAWPLLHHRTAVRSSSPMWWRISTCAHVPAQDSNSHNNQRNCFLFRRLGFRGQKALNFSSDNRGMGMDTETDRAVATPFLSPDKCSDGNRSKPPPEKVLTLPTILTIGRVACVPLLVTTFYINNWWGTTATTSIFILAAITDWLDGYLARKMKLGTAFGAFLDPVADKLMVAATLVLLCTRPPELAIFGQMPWLLTVPSIAIIGREITMSAVREWAASQNSKLSEAVAVNNLGKWKTAAQMTSLTILLATRDSSFTEAGFLVASGVALLYLSAGLAVWSLVVYMRKIWKVLLM